MEDPLVAIIILNWNGWEDTIECLESVFQINYPNYCVVLVDNHSTDDSINKILNYAEGEINVESNYFNYCKTNKPINYQMVINGENNKKITKKKLTFILNSENSGFAEGNNIGIRFALKHLDPKYLLLLNNDTVVDNDFLGPLINEGETNDKIGLLGPKMYYYDDPDVIWCVGGKIDWKFGRGLHVGNKETDNGQYEIKTSFDYINGAALLIKKELFESVGLLDEKYFLYFEETDLELRAISKGYENIYVPQSKVWHKISKSGGGLSKEIGLYYITRNRWIFMGRWAQKNNYMLFVFLQLLLSIVVPFFLTLKYKNSKLLTSYYHGFWDGLNY